MATSASTVIAAMAARARREVRDHFDRNNAFDPAHAVAYDPPTRMHQRQFDSLIGRGILLDTGDGRYWIDRAALRLEEERRRAAAMLMFKILLAAVFVSIVGVAVMVAIR